MRDQGSSAVPSSSHGDRAEFECRDRRYARAEDAAHLAIHAGILDTSNRTIDHNCDCILFRQHVEYGLAIMQTLCQPGMKFLQPHNQFSG